MTNTNIEDIKQIIYEYVDSGEIKASIGFKLIQQFEQAEKKYSQKSNRVKK